MQASQALEGVFVNSGDNPFELIKESIKYVLFLFFRQHILDFVKILQLFFSFFLGYCLNIRAHSLIWKTRR